MSQMTLKGGLEEALKQAAPEVKGVEAVEMA
jgi:Fe-S cluster biogenesis protein NfuA